MTLDPLSVFRPDALCGRVALVTGGGTGLGGSHGSLLNQTYRPAVSCE